MKKFLIILTLSLAGHYAFAQKPCCPVFKFIGGMEECAEHADPATGGTNGSGGPLDSTHEVCKFQACKNVTQTYYIFPNEPGYTYSWQVTGGVPATLTGNPMNVTWGNGSQGIIKIFIKNADSTCRDTIIRIFCLKDAPHASFNTNPGLTVCSNTLLQFTNTSTGGNIYSWNFGDGNFSGDENPTHVFSSPGTYNVILTVSNDSTAQDQRSCGCKDTAMVTITVKPGSGLNIIPGCKKMLCKGDTASYCTTANCNSFNWSVTGGQIIGPANGKCISVVWNGSYPAVVNLNGNCGGNCGNSTSLNVPVLYPTMPITGSIIVCPSSSTSYSLPAMPGTFYGWHINGGGVISGRDSNTNIIHVNWGASPGTYTITCYYNNPNTKCSGTATTSVTILLPFTMSGSKKACVGGSFNYTAAGSATWQITPSTGFAPATFPPGTSISGIWNAPGTYTVTATPVTSANYCSYPAIVQVIVSDTPRLNPILGPLMICPGSTQVYSASSNMNDGIFTWFAQGGTVLSLMGNHHDSTVVQWGSTGPYTINVSQQVGDCFSSIQTVAVDSFPNPVITGKSPVCADETVQYTVTGIMPPGGWVWSIVGNAGSIVGQTANTVTILWNGNVSPSITSGISVMKCGTPYTLPVIINTPPPVVITRSGNLCNPGVTLSAGALPCYQWYLNGVLIPQATGSTYLATVPGHYEVHCPTQCSGYGSITVPSEPVPLHVMISPDNFINYCTGASINMNLATFSSPSPGCSFQWYKNGVIINGQTFNTLNVTSTGSYFVINTCGNCKDTSNIINITEGPCLPGCKVDLPFRRIDDGLAKGPADYFYETNAPVLFTTGINIGPPTNYCNNPAFSATYTIDPPKTFNSGISWDFGDGFGFSYTGNGGYTPTHHYNTPGIYIVTASFATNCPVPPPTHVCTYYDTIHYIVPIAANFSYFVNCKTVTLTNLSATLAGCNITSYSWSYTGPAGGSFSNPAAASPVFTATQSGVYNIKLSIVSSCNGCTDFIIIPVTIQMPSASFTPPSAVCAGAVNTFSGPLGMPHYLWNFGDNSTSTLQATSHTYQLAGNYTITLTVTDANGCTDMVSHPITVNPGVMVSAGSDVFICPQTTTVLNASPASGLTYQWYKNGVLIPLATAASYPNAGYGTYYVQATNSFGCTALSAPVHGFYKPAPVVKIKTDGSNIICISPASGSIQLHNIIQEPGCTYTWSGYGAGSVVFYGPTGWTTTAMVTGTTGTNYYIVLSAVNADGCTAKDTFCVYLYKGPSVTVINPPGSLCEGTSYTFTANALPILGSGSYLYQWSNGITGNPMITSQPGYNFVIVTDPHGCQGYGSAATILSKADISLFPVGCDTLCLTDTVHFPLPLGGGLTSSSYTIQWYDSGTPVGTNSINLPLAAIGPGDHHFYAVVTLAGGCADTTGTFDLFVKDCTLTPPCDNCNEILSKAAFTASTFESGNMLNGVISFTSLKQLKEVHISIADLAYHWNDPKCVNCKVNLSDRACLFPVNATQTVGTLAWDNFSGVSIPPASGPNDCPRELIFKPGIVLAPGTYSIPVQFSFPAPASANCKLIIDKICMHILLKDEDCKVCERNLCKQDSVVTDGPTDSTKCGCSAGNNWTNLFMVPLRPGVPKPKTLIFCGSIIRGYEANVAYTLSGMYNCRPGCVCVKNEVVIRNQTGDIIYTHSGATLYENILFPEPGPYTITLTAWCGDKKCECVFKTDVTPGTGTPEIIIDPGGHNPPVTTTVTPGGIDKVLSEILPPDFNGAVLVAQRDSILYEKYTGKVNTHTAFDLASVAKTFTAMAILKMAEEKKLNLNDDPGKYLDGFPFTGITLKMLLSHRSGLDDYVKFLQAPEVDKTKMMSNADLLQYIIANKNKVQIAAPGAAFDYSNTNFALLALIIEKVSGQTYPQYLSDKFFKPLHMDDTYVFGPANSATSLPSYYKNGKPYELKNLDYIFGDKNIYTTVKDMMKWDKALRDGKIFSKETLTLAYTPGSPLVPYQSNYGLGWRILQVPNGKKMVYHNGWWHGMRSVFIRLTDEDAVIIILSNSSFATISESRKLADLFGQYQQAGKSIVNF